MGIIVFSLGMGFNLFYFIGLWVPPGMLFYYMLSSYTVFIVLLNYENIYFNTSTLLLTLDKEVKLESLCTTDLFWSSLILQ